KISDNDSLFQLDGETLPSTVSDRETAPYAVRLSLWGRVVRLSSTRSVCRCERSSRGACVLSGSLFWHAVSLLCLSSFGGFFPGGVDLAYADVVEQRLVPASSQANVSLQTPYGAVDGSVRDLRGSLKLDLDRVERSEVVLEGTSASLKARGSGPLSAPAFGPLLEKMGAQQVQFRSTKVIRTASDRLSVQGIVRWAARSYPLNIPIQLLESGRGRTLAAFALDGQVSPSKSLPMMSGYGTVKGKLLFVAHTERAPHS
ncbi:MAG: hypothetical protein KDD69_05500, partial [Bdellovibrionales bacterium]|nr:hypothetical protein [Bdellovibrionales bacterium]